MQCSISMSARVRGCVSSRRGAIAWDGRVTLARSLPPASVQEIYSERRVRDRESQTECRRREPARCACTGLTGPARSHRIDRGVLLDRPRRQASCGSLAATLPVPESQRAGGRERYRAWSHGMGLLRALGRTALYGSAAGVRLRSLRLSVSLPLCARLSLTSVPLADTGRSASPARSV